MTPSWQPHNRSNPILPHPQVEKQIFQTGHNSHQGTASAPQAPVKEVASEDLSNQFAPGFEDTLRELQASASQDIEEDTEELQEEMEEQAELASRRAPRDAFQFHNLSESCRGNASRQKSVC